jgi:hypothetical protein
LLGSLRSRTPPQPSPKTGREKMDCPVKPDNESCWGRVYATRP